MPCLGEGGGFILHLSTLRSEGGRRGVSGGRALRCVRRLDAAGLSMCTHARRGCLESRHKKAAKYNHIVLYYSCSIKKRSADLSRAPSHPRIAKFGDAEPSRVKNSYMCMYYMYSMQNVVYWPSDELV